MEVPSHTDGKLVICGDTHGQLADFLWVRSLNPPLLPFVPPPRPPHGAQLQELSRPPPSSPVRPDASSALRTRSGAQAERRAVRDDGLPPQRRHRRPRRGRRRDLCARRPALCARPPLARGVTIPPPSAGDHAHVQAAVPRAGVGEPGEPREPGDESPRARPRRRLLRRGARQVRCAGLPPPGRVVRGGVVLAMVLGQCPRRVVLLLRPRPGASACVSAFRVQGVVRRARPLFAELLSSASQCAPRRSS
jgi:hypothetical protein